MTRITRITMAALAALAIVVPAAAAVPIGLAPVRPQTDTAPSSLTETASGQPTWPGKWLAPESVPATPLIAEPPADDDDTSALVYIVPGVIVGVVLAAGLGYAVRTSGRPRRARVGT